MSQHLSASAPAVVPAEPLRGYGALYMELGKARLSSLVVVTTAVGYLLGAGSRFDALTLLWTLVGTSLAAAAAGALNQVIERHRDAMMPRTRSRPLPAGRIGLMHAVAFAILTAGFGVTLLAAMVNGLTAGLALATIAIYLLVYTPLKTRTTLNTLAGAVVGAIPPMMGWAAATGGLEAGAWVLGATLFVWQVPHFLALAWMYRKDYELGGYRMLPTIDPTGAVTCRAVVLWSLALLPVTLAAMVVGISGWIYGVGAVLLGLWLVRLGGQLYRERTAVEARRLFLATVVYLPVLMGLMVFDRVERGGALIEFELAQPVTPLVAPAAAPKPEARPAAAVSSTHPGT